jgi:glycosyltransferase involved in cell wall biosynthesis
MNFKVIIPTHNAADYLDLCLYSLKKYSVWNHEYYIILDDCSDHTMNICDKYNTEYTEVNYRNPYLTRNESLNMIEEDDDVFLFMTADDMFASPDWDVNILSHHEENKDVIWSSQLTDYLLHESFEENKKNNPSLTMNDFSQWWGSKGIHMDFYECGRTAATFNEEIFLTKFEKISQKDEYYYSSDISEKRNILCNTNFLILNSFWHELNGWPLLEKELEDARLGNNDILFQNKIEEVNGRNIVPKDVLFFHFGGRTINRK